MTKIPEVKNTTPIKKGLSEIIRRVIGRGDVKEEQWPKSQNNRYGDGVDLALNELGARRNGFNGPTEY